MNKVVSFFVTAVLFLTFNLPLTAQKQARNFQNALTEFASTQALSDGNGVLFRWQMDVESNNLGFNIYRVNGDKKEIINPYLISGGFLQNNEETTIGGTYTFFDPKGSLDYTYLIETLAVNGQKIVSNLISVKYAENLAEISGKTSAELIREYRKANYRIEKNDLLFSKELQNEIEENALPPDLINQRIIAAQPGVKLGVQKEGIYRVSRTELANAGFDVNRPSGNWQLYMNGNEQAIIVGDNGQYIEFYGQGINTIESATQIYYLINGTQPGKRIGTTNRRRFGGTVISNSYEQSFYKADRAIYLSSIRNGDGNNFFSGNVINTTGTSVTFNLDGIDPTFTEAFLTIGVQGLTASPHNTNITFNGVSLAPITGNNLELMTKTYQIPTSLLIEGQNNILFKVTSSSFGYQPRRINQSRLFEKISSQTKCFVILCQTFETV